MFSQYIYFFGSLIFPIIEHYKPPAARHMRQYSTNNMRKKCRGKNYNCLSVYIYIPAEGVAYELNALTRIRKYIEKKKVSAL